MSIQVCIGEARRSPLKDSSIDLFMSNYALEHLNAEVHWAPRQEFKRLFALSALMSHRFGLTDQFVFFATSIAPINCLKFSELECRSCNNRLRSQTRLRILDYQRFLGETGFEVWLGDNADCSLEDSRSVSIAAEFKRGPDADLLTVRSTFGSRPRRPSSLRVDDRAFNSFSNDNI